MIKNNKNSKGFGSKPKGISKILELKEEEMLEIENEGNKMLNKGRVDKAETLYKKLIKANYTKPGPYINLSRIYRKSNRQKEGIEILKKSLLYVKGSTFHITELSAIYKDIGQGELCINFLSKAIQIEPNSKYLLNLYESSSKQLGKINLALLLLIRLSEFKPEESMLIPYIARLLKANKNYLESIKYYEKALCEDNFNTDLLIDLANCYQDIGDYEASIKIFEKIINISPDNQEAYYGLGLNYKFIGDYTSAVNLFKKATLHKDNFEKAIAELIYCEALICDWSSNKERYDC